MAYLRAKFGQLVLCLQGRARIYEVTLYDPCIAWVLQLKLEDLRLESMNAPV